SHFLEQAFPRSGGGNRQSVSWYRMQHARNHRKTSSLVARRHTTASRAPRRAFLWSKRTKPPWHSPARAIGSPRPGRVACEGRRAEAHWRAGGTSPPPGGCQTRLAPPVALAPPRKRREGDPAGRFAQV